MEKKQKVINNVSATTAIDLKAELAHHLEQFEKVRSSAGKQVTARKPDKKPTVWTRQNKGIDARNERDKKQQLEAVEGNTLVRSREQLEKKAKIYEALRTGKYKDSIDDENGPLIDFDRKYMQEKELEKQEYGSEKKKRKRQQQEEEDDDPWVEYEDEFGRTRIVRRSELPKRSPSPEPYYSDEESGYSMERPDYEKESVDRFSMNHYEADREIRTKGVGFYGFSKDEHERREQLAKLNQIREETENARKSAASASDKRKQMLAKNAEKIRARKAVLQAKRQHQLNPEQVPKDAPPVVNEESVDLFLQSIRKQIG
ncbi:hypothetical protein BD770DRAFT_360503 [Pilaira anomala]|nr:hypothetical protein BD770DRAFT_360503 [Pilaira anomala]